MYEIRLTNTAKRQLAKLEKSVQSRITGVLERIRITPQRHLKKLAGINAYRLRTGDYRAILQIDETELIIHVLKVGHRKNIYDGL